MKPENILLAGGRVLVTDFGVALRGPPGAPGGGFPVAGSPAGTPAYMAPEQLLGEAVDARADVFGLCATLFEMVHGAPPFADLSLQERLRAPIERLPPPPRSASLGRLHRIAARGLHADPARRPQSCEELAAALAADPAARTRQLVVGAGVVLAAAGAFWGGRALLSSPEQQCRAGENAIATAWNGQRRAELAARYAGAPEAAASWPALERMLDGYAAGWRAMYGQSCSATYGGKGQTGPVLELRLQCLEARQAAVDAFLSALATARGPQLLRASRAVLPEVSDCAAPGRLETRPLPADPQARAQIKEIEKRLAEARAQFELGEYPRAEATGEQAVAAARKLSYEPLLAAALIEQGTAAIDIAGGGSAGGESGSALDRAAKLFEEAYAVAERGRDDRRRLSAASQQVILQTHRQDLKEGERWARLAEGLLARLGNPATEGSSLHGNIGWLRQFQGKDDEAAAAFQRSLDLARQMAPPNPRRMVLAQAGVCRSTREPPARVACTRKLIETATAAYGARHPDLGLYHALLAEALLLRSSTHAEACPVFRKALELIGSSIDPRHPNAVSMRNNLAECLLMEGEVKEAKGHYEELIRLNPGPTDMGYLHTSYGLLLSLYGDLPEGVRQMRMGLASFLKAFEPSNENVLYSRNTLAEALIRDGQLAQAQRVLDDGIPGGDQGEAGDHPERRSPRRPRGGAAGHRPSGGSGARVRGGAPPAREGGHRSTRHRVHPAWSGRQPAGGRAGGRGAGAARARAGAAAGGQHARGGPARGDPADPGPGSARKRRGQRPPAGLRPRPRGGGQLPAHAQPGSRRRPGPAAAGPRTLSSRDLSPSEKDARKREKEPR